MCTRIIDDSQEFFVDRKTCVSFFPAMIPSPKVPSCFVTSFGACTYAFSYVTASFVSEVVGELCIEWVKAVGIELRSPTMNLDC